MEQHFAKSITKLENLIHKLEVNTGIKHTKSPFNIQINQPVIKQTKIEEKKNDQQFNEQPTKKEINLTAEQQKIIADYSFFELRIGEITECQKIENSDKLYAETISFGSTEKPRQIASGLQQFVPLADMKGLCLVFANLKEKKLAGFPSHGMILCASNKDHSQVEILRPEKGGKAGERVLLEIQNDIKDEQIKEITPKDKKIWELFEEFSVDENSFAAFKGIRLKINDGYIKCQTLQKCQIS